MKSVNQIWDYIQNQIKSIKETVEIKSNMRSGGGVDSSVAAIMVHRAIMTI